MSLHYQSARSRSKRDWEDTMRAIDLHVNARELANTYGHMRVWLDRNDCAPVDFDETGDRTGTVHIRVCFEDDDLADAFQREFVGSNV
jgi:hypothetical protein